MLRPIESVTREVKSLDGLWRFAPDSADLREPWARDLPGDLHCPVPSSYNELFLHPNLRNHVGKVWYQREFIVPRSWAGRRVAIRFDAATHEGEVWVKGKQVVKHEGGYTPFEANITDQVEPGEEVTVTVGVNNILTPDTLPPGEMITNDVGHTAQMYWHDFFNYAGLARSVNLVSSPKSGRVEDITVATDVKGVDGTVQYTIVLNDSACATVAVRLLDATGKETARGGGLTGTLSVPDAHLWQPGAAYLYRLRVRVSDANGSLADEYSLPIGIRTVKVEGLKFLINGKPFYFKGYGRHEDSIVRGKGHDNALMVHDFELMKWSNANSFRTAHYPYAEEVYEHADRTGVVIIDETAACGLNQGLVGGLHVGQPRSTFGDHMISHRTQATHKQAIRELIARDKNHPSVVMWSITNEPASNEQGAREYFAPLVDLARELDPTRPITFANVMRAPVTDCLIADLFDVILVNRYYGWYRDTADLDSAAKHLEAELRGWQEKHHRPLIIGEYGVDSIPGVHALYDQVWSEEFQSRFYDVYHGVFDQIEAVVGEHAWNFADFQTSQGIFRVDGNRKGVFTRDRKPKMAAHTLKKRWAQRGPKM